MAAGVAESASSEVVPPPVVESTYQASPRGPDATPGASAGSAPKVPGSMPQMPMMPGMPGMLPMPGMPGMPDMSGQQQAERVGGFTTGNIYIPPKDEGKMFIGGLNWETTDESMRNYFSQFGEVLDCTVMRDNATGRSRGFGFLTFKDAHCVTMVVEQPEHYLDGKIIDPKRAIPREEQDKTAKIFVGGVGGDVTEYDFKSFFDQYGTVIDAQLMIDKDTGRPRGFGFVTFDSSLAVERIVAEKFLILKGKPIEVKRAEPRTKGSDSREQDMYRNQMNNSNAYMNGMNPALMSQYYQRWQMYMAQMQQQMLAMSQGGQMNPAMMQQFQQMQQMNPMMGQPPQQPYESPSANDDDGDDDQGPSIPTGPRGLRGDDDNDGHGGEGGGGGGGRRGGGDDHQDRGQRYRDRNFGSRVSRDRDFRDGGRDRDRSSERRRSRSPIPRGPRGMRGGGFRGGRNGRGGYHPYHRN